MDRLNQLRGAVGGSGDSTLDTTSPPSEAYMSANESSSKYFSLSEVDSSFDISPIKDVSLASATADPKTSITEDGLITNLSPIRKKSDILDSYKIGKQIEAANILSGGVDIFDDNDNSYDGDELVIDDNIDLDDKSNSEIKQPEPEDFKSDMIEQTLIDGDPDVASKDTEVVLQIDGKNVDAIDIGNGLYLYRREGEEELAAVQIIDDDKHQPSFKFLKVRENVEGNLEVYEEIEIEVPKELPTKEGNSADKNTSHVPIRDINKVINDNTCNKVADRNKTLMKEPIIAASAYDVECEFKDVSEFKSEVNLNGKMMKFSESRKSPVIGSFAYHSTPNKEGKPLTKTMVDLQLHPSRHSDNVKKTIEVHTDSCKQKNVEGPIKNKESFEEKESDILSTGKEDTAMITEGNCEENLDADKIINENKNDEILKVEKSDIHSRKDNVINSLDTTDKITPEAYQPIAITEQHRKGHVPKNYLNNILETEVSPENLEKFDKIILIESDDRRDITIKNDNHMELEDGNENILKMDVSVKHMLSNEALSVSDKKTKTNVKCPSIEIPQKVLLSQDEKTQNKDKQDNIAVLLGGGPTNDAIVEDDQVPKKNNSLDVAKISLVPKDNLTLNLGEEKDIKENNIVKDGRKVKNMLIDTKNTQTTILKAENEVDVDIGQLAMEKVVKEKVSEEKQKDIANYYLQEIKDSGCDSKQNHQNTEISQSNKSTLLGSDIQNKTKNKNVDNSLQLTNTENSMQSNEKVCLEQKHDVVESNDFISSIIEKPNSDCKNIENIVQPKKDIDALVHAEKVIETVRVKKENVEFKLSENMGEMQQKPEIYKESVQVSDQIETKNEIESNDRKKDIKLNIDDSKPINNNSAVPFGKWTEANRQEFVNKFKGLKAPVNSTNNKQIKNSNDLNRRDILKKIDSQRQSISTASKVQDVNKINVKTETVFINKPAIVIEEPKIPNAVVSHESKIPVKSETSTSKAKEVTLKKSTKQEFARKSIAMPAKITATVTGITKKESVQRKAVKDLIDKTIEGMINKAFPSKSTSTETKPNTANDSNKEKLLTPPTTLDAIEMKMNELHGIPFIERPPHELPKVHNPVPKNYVIPEDENVSDSKPTNVSKLPLPNQSPQKLVKDNVLDVDSEEEVIEHEPVTGDIVIKQDLPSNLSLNQVPITKTDTLNINKDNEKKEPIITEKDFDKFVRRNSVTYENCLTVNFEKIDPHSVLKTAIEKDKIPKNYIKNEVSPTESKQKLPSKLQNVRLNTHKNKVHCSTKLGLVIDDPSNKNYSKLQMAYQSALTAKRQLSCPITIIEDQPVKVLFMDTSAEFVPNLLNIQGQELSPSKNHNMDETNTVSTTNSVDSDMMDAVDSGKPQDDIKFKTKHQRKQVLTPVETPELELIEPLDLGIEISPKKKRKTEDKNSKNVIHKKSYLLGRTDVEDKVLETQNLTRNEPKLTLNQDEESVTNKDTVTAIDNLVKAAELLENQSENMNSSTISNPESLQSTTPVKRGRGRPRKYPLPDGATDKAKVPSPQKKPRLIDAKPNKRDTEDEESTDDEKIKENWTMGKINENIVCPICNKLFRSENVVFKHVKHCTGPSPNRSDASKRSPRRGRHSKESDDKSHGSQDEMDVDEDKCFEDKGDMPKKRKSKDSITKSETDKEVIDIEDTPVKEKSKKHGEEKQHESRLTTTNKLQNKSSNNLECEFCGKIFRQLSYLANHKLQHKKEDTKKIEKCSDTDTTSVFSCDICKKEFRKLHHLVQHRNIHNPNSIPTKFLRKNSSELTIDKTDKEESSKQSEDPSAGFRCEPCDKSFRKLHHLVEHRETHDGINRQKITFPEQPVVEKQIPPPQCDICKKTFRKLHHLIEHKEQHVETSSEKSDDKSVKSSLSTKDIIHECSLCYMVFPNEHSLNKHTVICQKKKRQSKQPKPVDEGESETVDSENVKVEENKIDDGDEPEIILEEFKVINLEKEDNNDKEIDMHILDVAIPEKSTHLTDDTEHYPPKDVEETKIEIQKEPVIIESNVTDVIIPKVEDITEVTEKQKEIDGKEIEIVQDNAKKKIRTKDKVSPVVTKRQKRVIVTLPTVDENKPLVESSDDDDVRYMLNPDFKPDDASEGKLFMKVRAKKRNSLQIERPNSKDLIKRRTSLQHPPKIPRLKSKPNENKIIPSNTSLLKNIPKIHKLEPVFSTDSEDSDVKYSFPIKTIAEKKPKPMQDRTPKETEKRTPRRSLEEKRKSLIGIATRKSLGKPIGTRPKAKQSPVKQVKKRTRDIEHRCDCGQLFSSAALLSRHTSLAHTPPRIRKRRSPPPELDTKTINKPKNKLRKSPDKPKQTVASRKSSIRSEASNSKQNQPTKSTEGKSNDVRKSMKTSEKVGEPAKTTTNPGKLRRSAAHKGVPVPEKMRKLKQKGKI